MKYRVYRTVVTVQYTIVEADTPDAAADVAREDPNMLYWIHSSENDPAIMEVVEE